MTEKKPAWQPIDWSRKIKISHGEVRYLDRTPADDPWFKVTEVARHLDIHRLTVYRWIKRGLLKAFRVGRGPYLVRASDLDALLAKKVT